MTSDSEKLRKRARRALNELWRAAHAEDTPPAYRFKLLQWFAELGIGKPKAIADDDRGGGDGRGVVLLPATDADTALGRSGFDRFVDAAICRAIDEEDEDLTV